MLTEKKIQAIGLLIESKTKKTDIAKMLGISRATLYHWLDDDEFKAELDRQIQRIQLYGENQIKANLASCIDNMVRLANYAESEKVRHDANQYLIDRVLGKTTAKIDIEATTTNEQAIDADKFEEELADWQKPIDVPIKSE